MRQSIPPLSTAREKPKEKKRMPSFSHRMKLQMSSFSSFVTALAQQQIALITKQLCHIFTTLQTLWRVLFIRRFVLRAKINNNNNIKQTNKNMKRIPSLSVSPVCLRVESCPFEKKKVNHNAKEMN